MKNIIIKRAVYAVVVICLLVSAIAIPVSAASKADVVKELKGTFISKYVNVDGSNPDTIYVTYMAENALRDLNFTEEQGDLFVQWIRECATFVSDKGPTAHPYSAAEQKFVMDRIYKVAKELDLTVVLQEKGNGYHKGDIVFCVYDREGTLIFMYDGDAVKKTGDITD